MSLDLRDYGEIVCPDCHKPYVVSAATMNVFIMWSGQSSQDSALVFVEARWNRLRDFLQIPALINALEEAYYFPWARKTISSAALQWAICHGEPPQLSMERRTSSAEFPIF